MLRTIAALGFALSLTGCLSVEEQMAVDVQTCTNFGAEYGSPAHYQCMLIQQQRRDEQARQAQIAAAQAIYAINSARW